MSYLLIQTTNTNNFLNLLLVVTSMKINVFLLVIISSVIVSSLEVGITPDLPGVDLSPDIITGGGSGGNVTTFLGLSDTPSSYSGSANKCVVVNGSSNALVFNNCSTISSESDPRWSGNITLVGFLDEEEVVTQNWTFEGGKTTFGGGVDGPVYLYFLSSDNYAWLAWDGSDFYLNDSLNINGNVAANNFYGNINASYIQNAPWAGVGTCPTGQFVQNTTTGGVECATPSGSGVYTHLSNFTNDIHDQELNTTSNVTFQRGSFYNNLTVNITTNITNNFAKFYVQKLGPTNAIDFMTLEMSSYDGLLPFGTIRGGLYLIQDDITNQSVIRLANHDLDEIWNIQFSGANGNLEIYKTGLPGPYVLFSNPILDNYNITTTSWLNGDSLFVDQAKVADNLSVEDTLGNKITLEIIDLGSINVSYINGRSYDGTATRLAINDTLWLRGHDQSQLAFLVETESTNNWVIKRLANNGDLQFFRTNSSGALNLFGSNIKNVTNITVSNTVKSDNDCGITSGVLTLERGNPGTNTKWSYGNGQAGNGVPMACNGIITSWSAGQSGTPTTHVADISINNVNQGVSLNVIGSYNASFNGVISVPFSKGDFLSIKSTSVSGTVGSATGTINVLYTN